MSAKKWLTVLFTSAALLGVGCASSDVGTGEESLNGSSQDELLAPCTAIPLATGSFLGCTAFNTASVAATQASIMTASTIQAQLATQLNTIFASLSVVPSIAASTVTISSMADGFIPLFGAPIVLPLGVDGFFTGVIPFTMDGLPPLALNVWGTFPIVNGALATMPLTTLSFSVGLATTTAAATTMAATTSAIATSNALLASTFPLGFTCNAAIPLTCPGLAPDGFIAPSLVTPVIAPGLWVDP